MKLLLEKGADPTIENNNQFTPTCYATFHGDKTIIDHILDKLDDDNQKKYLLYHSLYYAIRNDNNDLMKSLCAKEQVAEVVNAQDQRCNSLLHYAIEENRVEAVKLLLENGAGSYARK